MVYFLPYQLNKGCHHHPTWASDSWTNARLKSICHLVAISLRLLPRVSPEETQDVKTQERGRTYRVRCWRSRTKPWWESRTDAADCWLSGPGPSHSGPWGAGGGSAPIYVNRGGCVDGGDAPGLFRHVHPWRMHVDVWQNQYNIVK